MALMCYLTAIFFNWHLHVQCSFHNEFLEHLFQGYIDLWTFKSIYLDINFVQVTTTLFWGLQLS